MTRVLVPLAILEGASVSAGLLDLLETVDVTVLGYHVLPEQTPPDQARLQYEDRANEALDDVTEEFAATGGAADHRLVFTHDRRKSIDRVAAELEADAFAITGATGPVERLLVPVTGEVAVDRITDFVATLVGGRAIEVTLFLATGSAEGAGDEGRARLDDAAAALTDAGVAVETRTATGNPFDALVDAATGHDAVVMGEQAPSLSTLLFGEESERIAAETVGPVIVVRRPSEADPDPA
ncbi:UspA domain-containing protein [Halosimplex carlsbadense 2-9-1]|uniref:UspA domain-containing protein n=1 Tax=Halosimplex carlsbadense 2-9-1 TaxID=797114 RepID=M0D5I6_9EURY|nr:universal stress protein [Halosimplex carlsbadense]ELZ29424.1 UspA domain-containing protein [Halosimplex carlsbadense 2-9-1]